MVHDVGKVRADIAPENDAKMREAMGDPESIEVTVTGRNGYKVTHRMPLFDYEAGTVNISTENKHRPIYNAEYADGGGRQEPLPYSRVISYTLETRIR